MALVDYPILAAPTISLGSFRNVLANAGSPAAPEAIGIYNAAVQHGVDPAVLLAVFQHESNFGKSGIAVGRDNGFGLRYYGADAYGGTNRGGWYAFPSWTAGAQHAAALLAGSKYGGSSSYNTVRTFPARYAPSSDGNNPTSYGSSLAHAIQSWTGAAGVPYNPPTSTIAKKAPAPSAAPMTTGKAAAPVTPAAPAPVTHHYGTFALVSGGAVLLLLLIILVIGA